MKTNYFSVRSFYLYGFLAAAALLSASVYLQMKAGLQPCPLCVLQRLVLFIIGIILFFGAIARFKRKGQRVVGGLSLLFCLLGLALSGRQVWLQHSPNATPGSCGASIEYMLQVLPFDQVLKTIFEGSAECAQVGWEFLTLSIAEWSFIAFLIFAVFSIWQMKRK